MTYLALTLCFFSLLLICPSTKVKPPASQAVKLVCKLFEVQYKFRRPSLLSHYPELRLLKSVCCIKQKEVLEMKRQSAKRRWLCRNTQRLWVYLGNN